MALRDSTNLPYTKKLRRPILSTPPAKKALEINPVSAQQDTKRRSRRLANKPKSDLTMEVQATALLMKKCGATEGGQHQHTTMVEEFTETFVEPLVDDTVSGYREMFGLQNDEGADPFGTIAIHADD